VNASAELDPAELEAVSGAARRARPVEEEVRRPRWPRMLAQRETFAAELLDVGRPHAQIAQTQREPRPSARRWRRAPRR